MAPFSLEQKIGEDRAGKPGPDGSGSFMGGIPGFFLASLLIGAHLVCLSGCGGGGGPEGSAREGRMPAQFWWPYAETTWGNAHHDPALSDFTPNDPAGRFLETRTRFAEVEGDSIFTGMSFDDSRDRVYVPTGQSGQPNLFAYTPAGELVWTSADWDTTPWDPDHALDSGAVSGAPIVDGEGDLYLSDTRYLWASDSNGHLKWMAPLPVETSGMSYPVITPFFTRTGQVGGVTTAGRVRIFDRRSGEPVDEGGCRLPGVMASGGEPGHTVAEFLVSRLLWNSCNPADPYLMDAAMIAAVGEAFLGVGMAVANSPAVLPDPLDPARTRIYVPAILKRQDPAGPLPVRLFRVDAVYDAPANRVSVRADERFGGWIPGGEGSATSPTLSPDGSAVYVGDNRGVLHAFDTEDGRELWAVRVGEMLGSVTVAWDTGTIYVATAAELKRLSPAGRFLPCGGAYKDLARDDALVPRLDVDGDGEEDLPRVALPAGLAVASPNRVLLPLTLGYRLSEANGYAVWPMKAVLVALDREGRLAGGPYEIPDVVETTACADRRGNVYVAHASILSSVCHSLYHKFHMDLLGVLPHPVTPVGGITVLHASGRRNGPQYFSRN